jgi:hypothetical protein
LGLLSQVWFPANREELAGLIRKRYKNPVKVLPNDFLAGAINSFKGMRSELVRMVSKALLK